jgi:hypothetical protein
VRGARANRSAWRTGASLLRPHARSIEYIKTGKLRALAVTTATRSEALPDLPTVGDFLPGYEASTCLGVGAPKNTPVEIVDKLNTEINAGLADRAIQAEGSPLQRRSARKRRLQGGPRSGSPGPISFLSSQLGQTG